MNPLIQKALAASPSSKNVNFVCTMPSHGLVAVSTPLKSWIFEGESNRLLFTLGVNGLNDAGARGIFMRLADKIVVFDRASEIPRARELPLKYEDLLHEQKTTVNELACAEKRIADLELKLATQEAKLVDYELSVRINTEEVERLSVQLHEQEALLDQAKDQRLVRVLNMTDKSTATDPTHRVTSCGLLDVACECVMDADVMAELRLRLAAREAELHLVTAAKLSLEDKYCDLLHECGEQREQSKSREDPLQQECLAWQQRFENHEQQYRRLLKSSLSEVHETCENALRQVAFPGNASYRRRQPSHEPG
jgi:uncharacterized coiled-coil protein SlyX